MSIDIRDLMIGNFVEISGEVCTVTSIHNHTKTVVFVSNNHPLNPSNTYITNVNPVPITPELLERWGFEVQEHDTDRLQLMITTDDLGAEIDLYVLKNGYNVRIDIDNASGVIIGNSCFKHVKYAHELQNIVRLIGSIDLEVGQ